MDLDMKTHELKTEKGEFFVVDVSTNGVIPYIKLLVNNKLICKLSEITEKDAKGVVGESKCFVTSKVGYIDYMSDDIYKSPLISLHSLLTSKGIDINNGNWYLFEKI